MAISFLNKAGLTSFWAKIKATFALKSEIPDSTSDLTNDSGFIDSARFDITLTSSAGSTPEETVYTANKTYQQIADAIASGKIPYVTYSGSLFQYLGIYDGMIAFSWDGLSNLVDGQGAIISTSLAYTSFYVDSTNTWEWYANSTVIASKTSQLTNDSGFITSANIPQSDWSQNDSTAADYVKNRVCYTGNPVTTEIFSTTVVTGNDYLEINWNNGYLYFDSLEDGKEITLTIDGVTYNETLTWALYGDTDDGYYYCGNTSLWGDGGEDTGESYIIQLDRTYVYGMLKEAFDHDVTVAISTAIPEIHTLDDKYLNGVLLKRGTGHMSVILNGESSSLIASGDGAVAEGGGTTASGAFSHAEGSGTTASGDYSHSEGYGTKASGIYSHSEGQASEASGAHAHAEGWTNLSSGDQSHSEGYYNIASGRGSHAEGGAPDIGLITIPITGEANALTYTTNSKVASLVGFRIGYYQPTATIISETRSGDTITSITVDKTLSSSAVSNSNRTIYGGNVASGLNSHAEGVYTLSKGAFSHVEGYCTIASHRSQHVFGEYNVKDPSIASAQGLGTYVEIVGNGTNNVHSNARTLDWNGNEVLAGKLTVGAAPTANMDVATKQYVDTAVAGSGSAVTYTLSISNNVITLTGSDGSTSSVTLPVYAGGVSS